MNSKVAFITGVARGQGRAHAIELASRGVDIIGIDLCADIASMDYPNASPEDLEETIRAVKGVGGRIVAMQADVRDRTSLQRAHDDGVAQFGRIDILIANAGITRLSPSEDRELIWKDIIDVNLTGVWNSVEVVLPTIRAGKRGGSIVITSSSAGLKGIGTDKAGAQAYTAAKRGVVGLMQVLANEYASESIRVNTIHPTGVVSGMTVNDSMAALHAAAARGEKTTVGAMQNALPIDILQAEDIAKAVAWLVSDEAHYITGAQIPLDAGFSVR